MGQNQSLLDNKFTPFEFIDYEKIKTGMGGKIKCKKCNVVFELDVYHNLHSNSCNISFARQMRVRRRK